jgi:hypothetical protein
MGARLVGPVPAVAAPLVAAPVAAAAPSYRSGEAGHVVDLGDVTGHTSSRSRRSAGSRWRRCCTAASGWRQPKHPDTVPAQVNERANQFTDLPRPTHSPRALPAACQSSGWTQGRGGHTLIRCSRSPFCRVCRLSAGVRSGTARTVRPPRECLPSCVAAAVGRPRATQHHGPAGAELGEELTRDHTCLGGDQDPIVGLFVRPPEHSRTGGLDTGWFASMTRGVP